jgi:hypothetical protein
MAFTNTLIMKAICLFFCLLILTLGVQAQAYEGTVEYQKIQQPAAVIELPYSTDIVNAALNSYLSKKGRSLGNDVKGFTTYRNTQPLQNDSANADLFFKIERKSKKEKGTTVVSLMLTVPGVDSVTAANSHQLTMDEAKSYLNGLVPAIDAYSLELAIKDQNEVILQAEAKYNSLVDNGADLEKKRVALDKKVQDNKFDQQTQAVEVENQKQKLANLVSQRK